jgi:hypothetical protein
MSNVTPLFGRGHVEIDGGIVSAATITDAKGTKADTAMIGSHRFYVSLIEADGTSFGMWDGPSYDDAIREAESLARESAVHVVDRVGGGER